MFGLHTSPPASGRYERAPACQERGPDDVFGEAEKNDTPLLLDPICTKPQRTSRPALLYVLAIVVVLQSITLLAVFGTRSTATRDSDSSHSNDDTASLGLNANLKATSLYSPVFDAVNLRLHLQTFNGAFRDNTSMWRMPPSPEVDAAWDYISAEGYELITVSSEAIRRSGKDPSIAIKAPASWGAATAAASDAASDATYFAQVEVFHQVHCLNELRKEIYRDYYYGASPINELRQSHKAHCIHILLQVLMCSADVGIITHNWVHNDKLDDPKTRPFPDFDVVKKCRDFDALLSWVRTSGVQDVHGKMAKLRHPPGAPIVPGDGYI